MQIKGTQVLDGSLQGIDIEDRSVEGVDIALDTILLENLAPEVREQFDRITTNTKNILVNSTEIRGIKQQDLNPDLTLLVDSFDDDSNLDPASFNFEVESAEGYVNLIQGGTLFAVDSSEVDFNAGSFNNSEAFLDLGGDGAIRKAISIAGTKIAYTGFPIGLNVTLDGQTVPISTQFGTFSEGAESSAANITFPTPLVTTRDYTVDLGFNVNLTFYKFAAISYLKPESSNLKYRFELEDASGGSYTWPQRDFTTAGVFQRIKEEVQDAVGSINLTQVRYFRVRIDNVATDQTILSLGPQNGNNHMEVREDRTIKQIFTLTEDIEAQIVKLRVRWENANQPVGKLQVAISNSFETTLGIGIIDQSEATNGSWTDVYVQLDNKFLLKKDIQYALLVQSPETNGNAGWDVARTANNAFPQFQNFYNGADTLYNTVFDLLRPPISETIYFDDVSIETETTYASTASFISRPINLGLIPANFNTITWDEDSQGTDLVQIRIRTATTEFGLSAAPWSTFFSSGSGLGSVPTNQWIQYEVVFSGGDTISSDIIKQVTISYDTVPGQGNAIVISRAAFTQEIPTSFLAIWEVEENAGTSTFFVSRDGKATWQSINPNDEGNLIDFTSGSGTQVHLRAVLTGDARLYSWALSTDSEFIGV
jgi:hypothetical protein